MIITTTNSVDGRQVQEYKQVVFGEVITGVNFFKDLGAGLRNIFGGRSQGYEDELTNARTEALEEMNIELPIGHVTDFAQIATYGVMSTPALVLNGEECYMSLDIKSIQHFQSNVKMGLLKALNIVVNEKCYKDVFLNIVGTGDYKDYYESISRSLNLDDNVKFMGYINNDELPKILNSADVLCVSSTFETFCIPIVEAFSSGIPVITTNCTGPMEIVNKDNSIVVNIGDIESYADAIIKMKTNYNKYNKNLIKKYAYNKYDKSVVCKNIIEIAKNIINK